MDTQTCVWHPCRVSFSSNAEAEYKSVYTADIRRYNIRNISSEGREKCELLSERNVN